ncbi:MAG: hypothetical protein HY277_05460, partial [Ignavibacteriales bacterium]|nr:hypothetical protein [Ignavibacteriales bacterium]
MSELKPTVLLSTREHPRRWKPGEIVYLKQHYARDGVAAVASTLKRSVRAVAFRLTKLNLDSRKVGRWSKEEDAYLRRWYGRKRPRQMGRKLRRSWQSVTGRAVRLGLKVLRIRPWTSREITYLKRNYLRVKYKILALHLRRSVGTVNAKLRLLGLRKLHEKKKWTPRERRLVKKYYGKIPNPRLASMLGVAVHVLEKQARHQKLVQTAAPKYTAQELEYIRSHYSTMSAETIARTLGRNANAIRGLAGKKGWQGRKSLDTMLTARQQRFIRENYRKRSTEKIALSLGLKRSTVLAFARRVGLVRLMKPFMKSE